MEQNGVFIKGTHTIIVDELIKGSYNQGDTLVYQADGVEISVSGDFYVDKQHMLHHSHVFEDGTEMDFQIEYK